MFLKIVKSVTAPAGHATLTSRKRSCGSRWAALSGAIRAPNPKGPGMDDRTAEAALSLAKFGVGQPVRRSEDPTLVRGEGRYTDDVSLPGQAYAVMVRSSVAHGVIRGIDTAAAKPMPGVLGGLYGAPISTGYGALKCSLPLKNRDGSPIRYTPRPALAGRQGALCRRSGRLRGRGDGRAGEGRRRSGRRRHRAAAGGAQAGRGGQARRAAGLRRRCRTTSRSTITMATPRRWPRLSPRPRTSRG